jgi:endonuclease/exonuclease/phosphatase family metal-dependent hydrolase
MDTLEHSQFKDTKFIVTISWMITAILLSAYALGFSFEFSPEVWAQSPSAFPREIRVLTINVWSGLTYKGFFKMGRYPDDPERRYKSLVTAIRKLQPDIIAIQEANPLPDYANRLAADLDHHVIYGVTLGGIRFGPVGIPTNLREGDAILVKKPSSLIALGKRRLQGVGIVTNWFCFHLNEMTQAMLGRVEMEGKALYVYSVHLHSGPFLGPALDASSKQVGLEVGQAKLEQAKKAVENDILRRKVEIDNLIKWVEETLPPGMPAIILGDFNTTFDSGELEPLLGGGKWVDTFGLKNPHDEGFTWDPARNPNAREPKKPLEPYELLCAYHEHHSSRIDYILVNNNIPNHDVLESHVVLTPVDGVCASDHYGVLTTMRW